MDGSVYHNFDLSVEAAGEAYRARVIASPAGEGETLFPAPFAAGELAGFPPDALTPATARDLGGRLYAAVFSGAVRDLWQRSLQAAEAAGAGLRLRLRLDAGAHSRAPLLADWPWECLYDAEVGRFLALSRGTPVVRYLELPAAASPLAAAGPLRLLAVLAAPAGYPPLDTAGEWAGIQAALAPLAAAGRLTAERLAPATPAALQRRLRQPGPHILHFVGHAAFDPDTAEGVLVWEDEEGRGRPMRAARLAALLHDARETLRLVVLNTCATAQSSPADPFGGAAQALVRAGIPAAVAVQAPLADRAAITLAREFYAAIADDLPVDAALAEARKALFMQEDDMAWGNILLFMRSPDGRLFATQEAPAAEDRSAGEARGGAHIHIGGSYVGGDLDNRGGVFVGRDAASSTPRTSADNAL